MLEFSEDFFCIYGNDRVFLFHLLKDISVFWKSSDEARIIYSLGSVEEISSKAI